MFVRAGPVVRRQRFQPGHGLENTAGVFKDAKGNGNLFLRADGKSIATLEMQGASNTGGEFAVSFVAEAKNEAQPLGGLEAKQKPRCFQNQLGFCRTSIELTLQHSKLCRTDNSYLSLGPIPHQNRQPSILGSDNGNGIFLIKDKLRRRLMPCTTQFE